MEFRAPKPQGTFYTDYMFYKGFLYGIFEHDSRKTCTRMAKVDEQLTWKQVELKETESELIINLPDAHCQPLLHTTV